MMMVSSSTVVVSLILTLGFISNIADSLQIDLVSGDGKCIAEEVRKDSMSVGKYHVVNPNKDHPLPESHLISAKVTSPGDIDYHVAENVTSGQFSFHANEAGQFLGCFIVVDHKPPITLTLDIEWRTGMAVTDWSNVAKKDSINSLDEELKKLQDLIGSIHEDMFYLRDREKEVHSLNISTNSAMGWLSLLSLGISLSVAGLQFWHLKTFFEKKKLI